MNDILIPSVAASAITRIIMHPIDVLRIERQLSTDKVSLLNSIKSIGFRGFYRGFGTAFLFQGPSIAAFLMSYHHTRHLLQEYFHLDKQSKVNISISSVIAELNAGLLFTPSEVIKLQLVSNRNTNVSNIIKQNGFRGLFKGYFLGLVVFIPQSVTFFMVYEQLKEAQNNTIANYFYCSTIAGACGAFVSHPLDLIKTRFQASSELIDYKQALGSIYQSANSKNIFLSYSRGLFSRILYVAPSTAITITLFETLSEFI